MPRQMAPKRREPLSTERIVAQAVLIADEQGVGGLSMRSLAHSLGFEVMALYNHIANKQELLSLMVDAVAGMIEVETADTRPLDAVRSIAVSAHTVLSQHPWITELWQQHLPGPVRTDFMDTLLRLLKESGLSPDLAHLGFHAVTNHVMGYAIQQANMVRSLGHTSTTAEEFLAGMSEERNPHMVAHVRQHLAGDSSSSFQFVLDLILDGLVAANHES